MAGMLLGIMLIGSAGCLVEETRPAPGQTRVVEEPVTQGKFRLYVPTGYDPQRSTALLVTCHGTPPYDTADRQLREWRGLAEAKGFLVVAPELVGTRGDLPSDPAAQIERQRKDERLILQAVRRVKAAYSIDENRVFLNGWSAGAHAVLFTGLRNPDVFRALAIRQGTFREEFVEPCIPFLDRYQAVLVNYSDLDPLDNSEPMIDWLRRHEIEPMVQIRATGHKRDPERVFNFFMHVLRSRPYVRVVVLESPSDPMEIQFKARTSFEPKRYLWDFGDNSRSDQAEPVHTYVEPGLYTVKFAAWTESGKPKVRYIQLKVPSIRLGSEAPVPEE